MGRSGTTSLITAWCRMPSNAVPKDPPAAPSASGRGKAIQAWASLIDCGPVIWSSRTYRFTKCPRPCWYHATNRIHYYLQCKIRHVYMTWTFAKTLARKKITFAISEKTVAETVHYIPKGLRKGNPFQGPFAQLSYIRIYVYIAHAKIEYK